MISLNAVLIILTGLFHAQFAESEQENQKPIIRCPVTDKPARGEHAVTYRGGKICFCSANCHKTFKSGQAKYTTKANHQLVLSGQARQVACPVTGEKIRPKRMLTVGGIKVRFCCGGCLGRVAAAEPEIKLYLVFGNNAFGRGYKVQAKKSKKRQ